MGKACLSLIETCHAPLQQFHPTDPPYKFLVMETKLDLQEASHRSTISQDQVVDALSAALVGPEATYPCQKSQWSPSERPGTQDVEGPHHSACHHLQVWTSMPSL